jgi:hypothetical protein
MKHLSEEELIAQVYGEGDKAAVKRHLAVCAACAEAYSALQRDLAEIQSPEPPDRDANYGKEVWQLLAPSLPAYTARKWSWLRFGMGRRLVYAAAGALLVIGAFSLGRLWEMRKPPAEAKKQIAPPVKPQVVVVLLSDHLERSERLLVELKHADTDSTEIVSPLRDEAQSLLASNRVCLQDAAESGNPELQTALDHLDRLLTQLAGQQGGLNSAGIARLQKEMNASGLLFEVRVLRTRNPDQKSASKTRSIGGAI